MKERKIKEIKRKTIKRNHNRTARNKIIRFNDLGKVGWEIVLTAYSNI